MKVTRSEILSEVYRRSFYRFSLQAFRVLHNGEHLIDNWHIKFLCDRLQKEAERVVSNEPRNKHLIINVPPRTLKSELLNIFFTAWCWVKDPSLSFISSSYSASLSLQMSVQTRRLIQSDWFKHHFINFELSKDENTKGKFTNNKGGLRYCTSTGGTVTGMGADIIVIDDPQNPQLARSDTERENANVFFNETMRSRLNKPDVGMFIIIMQRLHENDQTGMLIKTDPDNFELICLPAELSESVKPKALKDKYVKGLLFPQRLTEDVLNGFKIGLGSYGYSGQYMQLPSPAEGGLLKKKWFDVINKMPETTLNFYLDTAYTAKQHNDATAMMCAGYVDNMIYIKEVIAVRLEFPELIKEIQNFVNKHGYNHSSRIYVEPKASGHSIIQQLKKTTGLNVIADKPPTQDKVSRVSAISAIVEAGRVKLMDGRYIDAFLNECSAFPNASNDDMVDVLVMAIDINTTRKKSIVAFG